MNVEPTPQIIFVREAPTKLEGQEFTIRTAAAVPELTRVAGGPNQKQVAISNSDGTFSVFVYAKVGGPIIQKIFPETSWTLLTSADIYIAGGGTLVCYVARTIYVNDLPVDPPR